MPQLFGSVGGQLGSLLASVAPQWHGQLSYGGVQVPNGLVDVGGGNFAHPEALQRVIGAAAVQRYSNAPH